MRLSTRRSADVLRPTRTTRSPSGCARPRRAIEAVEAPGAHADEPQRDRAAAAALAEAGLFELVVPPSGDGIDSRARCASRARCSATSRRAPTRSSRCRGSARTRSCSRAAPTQRAQLPAFARGAADRRVRADRARGRLRRRGDRDPRDAATADGYRLDGDKLFISNLGIADHATVFATTDPALGSAGLTAFWVPLDAPGVTVKPLTRDRAAPDRRARAARRRACRRAARIGEVGQGMKLAMQTLDAFRVSVGARGGRHGAARARRGARASSPQRVQFGKPLAEQPLVQAHLADMVVDLDAARLLVLRAAHRKDTTGATRHHRGLDREARRDRGRAARDRSRGAAVRRARRDGGRGRRAPLPRDPPAADLRGHERDPAHDHRARARARRPTVTSVIQFPDDLNLADYFLFDREREGKGDKVAMRFGDRSVDVRRGRGARRARSRGYLVDRGPAPEQRVYIVLPDMPPFAWAHLRDARGRRRAHDGQPDRAGRRPRATCSTTSRAAVLITTPAVATALAPRLADAAAPARDPARARRGDRRRSRRRRARSRRRSRSARAPSRSLDRARSRAAAARRRRCRAIRRDDPAIWLFTSGSTGRAEGRDAQPPRLRVQHRGLREAHGRLPRGRRHGQRAAAVLRLRDRHEPVVPVRGRRDGRAVQRAADRRERRRGDRALPADDRHQRADDARQAARSRRRAARARRARPRSVVACASTCRPARRCPSRCCARFIERFGGEVYDGIGSAEMFHIYCSNRPGDVMPGSLGRVGRGLRAARSSPRTPTAPGARRAAAAARSACCGSRATASRTATSRIATRAGRRSTATGAAPAICSRIDERRLPVVPGPRRRSVQGRRHLRRAARGRGLPARRTRRSRSPR